MNPNLKAFLDTIAWSELGPELLADPRSDNGYKCLVGGGFFDSYASHPNQLIYIPNLNLSSTAAGRYQLLHRYYVAYAKLLGLQDFSPDSQDAIATQQIKECKALGAVYDGKFAQAIDLVAHIWASLPNSGHDQRENKLADLQVVYANAGGLYL